ncbi:MAG TPA: DUF4388 domain-containing protein, partial [Pyrinomonadaceae bacterium]|nr:DUF4388 domain-containing protein [Pyrinomonadaceae bacterium]
MTPKNNLEIQGNFLTHPFAELIAEITNARLSGSLRVEDKAKKGVVYFRGGRIVFAASNARSSRLFEMLIAKGKLSKGDLTAAPSSSNDFEFAEFLERNGFLAKAEVDQLFSQQITLIVVDILSWESGDWNFSPLARARDGLDFRINAIELLVDHSRSLQPA